MYDRDGVHKPETPVYLWLKPILGLSKSAGLPWQGPRFCPKLRVSVPILYKSCLFILIWRQCPYM